MDDILTCRAMISSAYSRLGFRQIVCQTVPHNPDRCTTKLREGCESMFLASSMFVRLVVEPAVVALGLLEKECVVAPTHDRLIRLAQLSLGTSCDVTIAINPN